MDVVGAAFGISGCGNAFDRHGGGLTVKDAIQESAHLRRRGVRLGRSRVAHSAKVTPAAALVALDVQAALHDAVALRFSHSADDGKEQLRNAVPCHVSVKMVRANEIP